MLRIVHAVAGHNGDDAFTVPSRGHGLRPLPRWVYVAAAPVQAELPGRVAGAARAGERVEDEVTGPTDAGKDVLVHRRRLLVRVGALDRVVGHHVADRGPVDGVRSPAGPLPDPGMSGTGRR
jgi:hypothetical protein